jgi:glutaminase
METTKILKFEEFISLNEAEKVDSNIYNKVKDSEEYNEILKNGFKDISTQKQQDSGIFTFEHNKVMPSETNKNIKNIKIKYSISSSGYLRYNVIEWTQKEAWNMIIKINKSDLYDQYIELFKKLVEHWSKSKRNDKRELMKNLKKL